MASAAAAIGGGLLSGLGQGISQYAMMQQFFKQQKDLQGSNQNFLMNYLMQQQSFQMDYLTKRYQYAGLATPSSVMRQNAGTPAVSGMSGEQSSAPGHFINPVLTGSARNQSTQANLDVKTTGTDALGDTQKPTQRIITPGKYVPSGEEGSRIADPSSNTTRIFQNGSKVESPNLQPSTSGASAETSDSVDTDEITAHGQEEPANMAVNENVSTTPTTPPINFREPSWD